ncbi:MAG: hypothetical protein ACTHLW_21305 [Verrucomicrobiota bacterium]
MIKDVRFKPEFPEDWSRMPNLSPLATRQMDFDWELLRRIMGEAKEEMGDVNYALLADVLREILTWLVKGKELKIVGKRAVALAWVVNPDLLDSKSMRSMARQLGLSRGVLCRETGEASRVFKIRNRAQAHSKNWKARNANGA